MSVQQFQTDLRAFAKVLDLNIVTVTQVTVQKLWNKVTLRTPVDTGRARAGWGMSIGVQSVPTPKKDGTFDKTRGIPAPLPDLSVIDGTQAVFLLNNVEYMKFLEQGTSKQAPAGMVTLSIAELEVEIEAEMRSRGIGT